MYPANTHLKPVIGLDIHFVNLPFPFVPLPHPYIGLVIDPFDYIPFIGATVKVNGVPRGNTNTMGMIITFVHIPFGAGFTVPPIIGHNSQNFFGSKKVNVDGAPMSGANYFMMTCNDIGLPLSFRPGRKFLPIPSMYLPTSYCIPLQWGDPVIVGGPMVPNFSLVALIEGFLFGCFLKVLGKGLGRMMKALNNKLAGKNAFSAKAKSALCKMGFEPVDLVTGRVTAEFTDFELPGPIPICWTRTWDSDAAFTGPLGHGTHLCYDRYIRIYEEDGVMGLALSDGRLAAFPLLLPGEEFYHPAEKLLLRRKQNGHFLLEDLGRSLYLHFNHQVAADTFYVSFIENYSGFRVQLHYRGHLLSAMTDSAGRQLLIHHNDKRLIERVEVKHGSIHQVLATYQYNEEKDLVTVTDALDQTNEAEFNDHLMVRITDRNGQSYYWEYDDEDRCVHTYGDGGIMEGRIEYHEGFNVVTNSTGDQTTYWYDENNLCVMEVDHYGNQRHTGYTEFFEVFREIDELGNVTGYVYDDKARLQEKIFPDGTSIQCYYDDHNQLSMAIYPDGTSETYSYDESRRPRFMNYPNGRTVSYEYNEQGQLAAILENGSKKTSFQYDEDENLAQVELHSGAKAYWQYDALGRCTRAGNPEGQLRHYEYDALDRVTAIYMPDGNKVRLGYNAYEEVTSITDKDGRTEFDYTAVGNISATRKGGKTLEYVYDNEERLRAVVNEAGKYYSFIYNHRGEVTRETGFDGVEWRYERDAAGRVIKIEKPGERYAIYEYDPTGRIIRTEYDDGTWEIFRYDKAGNLEEAVNEHATVRFERDRRGAVAMEWQDNYCVQSSFDKYGNRKKITSSLGTTVDIQRDGLGFPAGVTARQDRITGGHEPGTPAWDCRTRYNHSGQEVERLMPGGLKTERSYDPASRPGELKVTRNGVVQSWKKYTWAPNDQLSGIFDAVSRVSTQFTYDLFGNLVFAQYADNRFIHRMADEVGNFYESRDQSDRRYNNGGAILESSGYVYEYDACGNLSGKKEKATQKQWRYEWAGNGLLSRVIRPDGKEVCFRYDALGRRIEKSFEGIVTRFIWDGNVLLHEWKYKASDRPIAVVDEWGKIHQDKPEPLEDITSWIFDPERFTPAAKLEDGKAFSIICDYLGTPYEMYDEQGKKTWEGVLDIYGRIRTLAGDKSSLPFRYQGQYEDVETGLYYNRFRYYDSSAGIYLSQDPVGLSGENLDLYGYVANPNAGVDIFGLICWKQARKNFWKNEAKVNPRAYSAKNLARMANGNAPKMRVKVFVHKTQSIVTKDVSMEIHHTYLFQRAGTPKAHETWNLTKAPPWAHDAMDPYRHTGYDLIKIIKGPNSW